MFPLVAQHLEACPTVIGYSHIFEYGVIYTETSPIPRFDPDLRRMMLSRNHKGKFGEYVGVVKGLIPKSPYFVLYMYFGNSPAHQRFKDRMRKKKFARKMKKTRRWGQQHDRAFDKMMKANSKLSDF